VDVVEALGAARRDGRQVSLVTVIAVEGDPPSHAGAKVVVEGGSVLAGTLGCSEFDAAAVRLAGEVEAAGGAPLHRRMVFGHGREQLLDLFAEVQQPPPRVIALGGTPVGRAIMQVTEASGRGAVLVQDDPAGWLTEHPPGPHDAVVLSDHDAPYVDAVLRTVLAGRAGFVGMLGSKRHAPAVMRQLRSTGVPAEQVARLHSPCGLDIGSRTPGEIALSIVAEIVAAERGRPGTSMGTTPPE
jgi:xanthine dehydrogenase accessory factor